MMDSGNEGEAVQNAISRDLAVLRGTANYREWIHRICVPFIGKRILEVGAGIGNYTEKLLGADCVLATDVYPPYVRELARRFGSAANVKVSQLDVSCIEPQAAARIMAERLDTVLMFNVLEHIADQPPCVRSLLSLIEPGGQVVVVGPAIPFLFNSLDRAYGHYRRHTVQEFRDLEREMQFRVVHARYFNIVGVAGWCLNGALLRRAQLSVFQTRTFDLLVPLLRRVESVFPVGFGLSVVVVLRKVSGALPPEVT
ncbi:MAG: hypothetical protein A3K19_12935 [Lentisphaerae bacterium RIFOXYB12_FULL_65_16]|nr:MAG: hypothetical protein A3K18_04770 [Lentisphaerae bacterium RIFOXYA12_64_32]OGV87217.1 MAG: hypothetical protein A3K19_12935 [Lentisphaerae bacterium RIFOXYB12_FULL_65_16]